MMNKITPNKSKYSLPFFLIGFYTLLIVLVIIILFFIVIRVKNKLGNEQVISNVQTNDDNYDDTCISLHSYAEITNEYFASDDSSNIQNTDYILIEWLNKFLV